MSLITAWLPDSRRLLYSSATHIMVLDSQTGASRPVIPLPRTVTQWGRVLSLTRDGRTLVYLATQSEGDVWMMTIDDKPR